MLVEVILKEPLSFSVFHYKNPKLQHTVQVTQNYTPLLEHIPQAIVQHRVQVNCTISLVPCQAHHSRLVQFFRVDKKSLSFLNVSVWVFTSNNSIICVT